jgi:hypothetical protein
LLDTDPRAAMAARSRLHGANVPRTARRIQPAGVTMRISLFAASEMRIAPSAVTATLAGAWSWALVAWPSSPLLPAIPVPATRKITPAADTFRTTLFVVSAIRNAPSAVAVTPRAC